jgi:cytochrome c oxidase subunit 2
MMKTVPILVLLFLQAPGPGAVSAGGQAAARRVVHMTAERFEFYPAEITVDQGAEIEIRITSEDTAHGFRIVGAGTNLVVPKRGRGEAVAVFNAVTPGRYVFECNRMCGAGHNFMRGVLIVKATPPAEGTR